MSSSIKPMCSANCGKIGILRCGRCLDTWYCSKECQAEVWLQHKGPCKEMAAAKAKVESDAARAEAEAEADRADDVQVYCSREGCGKIALERC